MEQMSSSSEEVSPTKGKHGLLRLFQTKNLDISIDRYKIQKAIDRETEKGIWTEPKGSQFEWGSLSGSLSFDHLMKTHEGPLGPKIRPKGKLKDMI